MEVMDTRMFESIERKPVSFDSEGSDLFNIFSERYNSTGIHEFKLYISIFKHIPNSLHEKDIDCVKANEWFISNYKSQIQDYFYQKRYLDKGSEVELDDIFYIMGDGLMVNFDRNQKTVRLLFQGNEDERIQLIVNGIKNFKSKKSKTSEIELLVSSQFGIKCKPFKIGKPKLRIEDNYNDDFIEVHNIILSRLKKKNDKGIVLLHGKPGTGKTTYIKFLLSLLAKKIIFIPPNMAQSITKPDLITLLTDNPNSILVIEDAENILIDRKIEGESSVSALLNLSDGLLSDCLNIQIICSFNTDLSRIDNALLRKGRLIARYEFKELTIDKTQKLADKLGQKIKLIEPKTLTEVYNYKEVNYGVEEQRVIGFNQK